MKKKWLTLPIALIMAGSLAFGAGCDTTETPPPSPVVTVQDGYVYVDGKKTDIQIPEPSESKSAFELWKEDNPTFEGTEADWIDWLEQLVTPKQDDGNKDEEDEVIEYKLIENGVFKGGITSGSAITESSALKMSGAVLRLSESVILPIGEDASWEVDITGKLLTGSATGAQLFVANPFTEYGRVYIGVNKNSSMLYIGVRVNTVYVNYGWELDASMFNAKHSYAFSYEDGIYYLSVDGGQKRKMSDINFNQTTQEWLSADAKRNGQDLNELIRTVLAQDYIEMTNIGVNGFECNSEISDFTVKTSAIGGYRRLVSHPLAGTRIFYLGSSITFGSNSGEVAFGEIINKISGNPFVKEAVSGTTLVDNGSNSYVQRFNKLNFNEKPDFLVVQLSTNDFTLGMPLGTVNDTQRSGFDTSTVSGAIEHIIASAKEKCPTVKVVFYAGAVENWGPKNAYESYLNGDLQKIREKWEIGVLDIFHDDYTRHNGYMADGSIHPSIEGYSAGWTPLFVKYLVEHL